MATQSDIEVLKTEVRGLHGAVSDIGAKMDVLLALQAQMVRLQEQHDNTRAALDRAFEAISNVKTTANSTEGRFIFWRGLFLGGAFVGSILFGFAQWYVLQQLHALNEVADQANGFNLRLTLMENKVWPDK